MGPGRGAGAQRAIGQGGGYPAGTAHETPAGRLGPAQSPRWRARRERDAKVRPACAGPDRGVLGGEGGVTPPGPEGRPG